MLWFEYGMSSIVQVFEYSVPKWWWCLRKPWSKPSGVRAFLEEGNYCSRLQGFISWSHIMFSLHFWTDNVMWQTSLMFPLLWPLQQWIKVLIEMHAKSALTPLICFPGCYPTAAEMKPKCHVWVAHLNIEGFETQVDCHLSVISNSPVLLASN